MDSRNLLVLRRFDVLLRFVAAAIVVCGIGCPALFSQQLLDAPQPAFEAATPFVQHGPAPIEQVNEHRFWDKTNIALFAATASLSAADFTVTHQNLESGGRELNPIVRVFDRNTATLALNFVAEDVADIGLSYFFHKTGHHRLERMVSFVNIGMSTGAVTYGLTHR
jgi:hypothetical protein